MRKKMEDGRPLRGIFCCGVCPTVVSIVNDGGVEIAVLECEECYTRFEIRATQQYLPTGRATT
jgi:transcription elongation factor Elf1